MTFVSLILILHMALLIVGAMPNSERIARVYNRVQLRFSVRWILFVCLLSCLTQVGFLRFYMD